MLATTFMTSIAHGLVAGRLAPVGATAQPFTTGQVAGVVLHLAALAKTLVSFAS